MAVFGFIAGADCAGIGGRLAEAIPDFRCMVGSVNYIDYPRDLDYDRSLAIQLWNEADLIYTQHGFRSIRWAMRSLRLKAKPFLVHYHGASTFDHQERTRHMKELRQWPTARGCVSTLDLAARSDLPWLPAPIPVDRLRGMRRLLQRDDSDVIRIAHAPTNRALKSTEAFIQATDKLRSEGLPLEVDLIEGVTWAECLARKARADIYFDQTVLGYGCNALEAWAMGQPVIAGADDETLDLMMQTIGHLPFERAEDDAASIYGAIERLCSLPDYRRELGTIGHSYVKRFHDYPAVAATFNAL